MYLPQNLKVFFCRNLMKKAKNSYGAYNVIININHDNWKRFKLFSGTMQHSLFFLLVFFLVPDHVDKILFVQRPERSVDAGKERLEARDERFMGRRQTNSHTHGLSKVLCLCHYNSEDHCCGINGINVLSIKLLQGQQFYSQ